MFVASDEEVGIAGRAHRKQEVVGGIRRSVDPRRRRYQLGKPPQIIEEATDLVGLIAARRRGLWSVARISSSCSVETSSL